MAIGIAIFMVGLVPVVLLASRVMSRSRREALPYVAPPRTVAAIGAMARGTPTTPLSALERPSEVVPPIDHRVFEALAAAGQRAITEVPRPPRIARGSLGPGFAADLDGDSATTLRAGDDLDNAQTLQPASDLDDDAVTRSNMPPVR